MTMTYTNTKRNEHPACTCRACKRGAGETYGKFIHRATNRKIRHGWKKFGLDIVRGGDQYNDNDKVVISTPYTD